MLLQIVKFFSLALSCLEAQEPTFTLEDTTASVVWGEIVGGGDEITLDMHLHFTGPDGLGACLSEALADAQD